MVTRNFRKMIRGGIIQTISPTGTKIVNINNKTSTSSSAFSSDVWNKLALLGCDEIGTGTVSASNAIFFGSGSTPPSIDDYRLEEPILAGIKVISGSHYKEDVNNDDYEYSDVFSVTIQNISNNDITINEYVLALRGSNTSYKTVYDDETSNGQIYVIDREVTDEPIIMHPNDIYTFVIKLKLW